MNIDLSCEYTDLSCECTDLSYEYGEGSSNVMLKYGASREIIAWVFSSHVHAQSKSTNQSVIKIMQTDNIDNFTTCTHNNYNAKTKLF